MQETGGSIIFINGPSSAGKSTLANAVWEALEEPFLRFSFDIFMDGGVLPMERIRNRTVPWQEMRPKVFKGYHHCLQALAGAGNHLIVDHIIEEQAWLDDLVELFAGLDVFAVGIYCSLVELERRELARGDRRVGEARRDLETVHTFMPYDLTLDCETPLEENVATLLDAWHQRKRPLVFEQLKNGNKSNLSNE